MGYIYWQKLAATFQMPNLQIHFSLRSNGCLFMWGVCFCVGAYQCDVVVVIKMGAHIHGCLFSVDAYYPTFMVSDWCNNMLIRFIIKDSFSY